MARGQRTSMRSVHTLPIVHEDENTTVVTIPGAIAAADLVRLPHATHTMSTLGKDEAAGDGIESISVEDRDSQSSP